jgi:cytochrome c oxidase subunit 3
MSDKTHSEHEAGGHGHSRWLAHHFDTPEQQFFSAKLGMWIFLVTEILFFSGLFCAYAVYRRNYPEIFADGHHFLDTTMGAINTAVLIFSSLTMAWAVRAAQLSQKRVLIVCLIITLVCAFAFLGVKYQEYHAKWEHRLVPGQARLEKWFGVSESEGPVTRTDAGFHPDRHYVDEKIQKYSNRKLSQAELDDRAKNLGPFFGIYFCLTGLHGFHVICGIIAITWLLVRSLKGHFSAEYVEPVDCVGLYWHLVDLIWIYLFPLLYLIH